MCDDCIWNAPDGCTEWECNPVTRKEAKEILKRKIVKCGSCKYWSASPYSAVGKCKHPDGKGRITNKNFYCGDGKEKDD